MSKIDISVVIPVKNGQKYLDEVLKAVFSQEINAEFEVIIIDSGSKDKTLDIIRKYPVRLYQIDEKEFNHGLTRNLGISKALGEYIVLMTSDAIPYNNYWMRGLVNSLKEDEDIAGVYSRQLPHKDSLVMSQIRVKKIFTFDKERRESRIVKSEEYEKLSAKEKHRFCNFDNVSSCIRKSIWEKVPFPKTDFAEDLEWAKKVLAAGKKIVYEPNSIVYHSHDFSVSEWYHKNRINSGKIYALFGVNAAGSFYKAAVTFFTQVFKDTYFLFRDTRQIGVIIPNMFLIPLFSLAGVLGQYRGIQDSMPSK